MKKIHSYIFILFLFIIIISSIIFSVYSIMTHIANYTFKNEYYISTLIYQNYKNIKHISIGKQKAYKNSIYTVYSFKDRRLQNPILNQYNTGICSIITNNKVQSIGNNAFTTYESKDDEEYVIRAKNAFTQIGFYDSNTDRCVIGGRVFDKRIKKIEIQFINGEVKQPPINEEGYFILIYDQDKFLKEKGSFYIYTDVISSITSYDINDKPLRAIKYKHNIK